MRSRCVIFNSLLLAFALLTFSLHLKADEDDEVIYTEAKLNCFIRKLKTIEKLDADYPEFNVTDPVSDCDSFVKDDYISLVNALSSVADRSNYLIGCFLKNVKRLELLEDYWLYSVYEASDIMPKDEKDLKMEQSKNKSLTFTEDITKKCSHENVFGMFFDNLVNKSIEIDRKLGSDEHMSKYCVRKQIIAEQLLNTTYNLIVNPENLDVEGVDCKTVLRDLFGESLSLITDFYFAISYDNFTEEQVQCIAQKSDEINFPYKMASPGLIFELNLNDEQMAIERKHYIESMTNAQEIVDLCP